jgi:hypothetical protein
VHGLTHAEAVYGWTLGGSIMTFAIPAGLFIVIAVILYFLFARPHTAPGHRDLVPAAAGAVRASAQPPATPARSQGAAGTAAGAVGGEDTGQAAEGARDGP